MSDIEVPLLKEVVTSCQTNYTSCGFTCCCKGSENLASNPGSHPAFASDEKLDESLGSRLVKTAVLVEDDQE